VVGEEERDRSSKEIVLKEEISEVAISTIKKEV
jgi:hypothetical protein